MLTARFVYTVFMVVTVGLTAGCGESPTSQFPQFVPTEQSQRAVFLTTMSWSGVAGKPLQTRSGGRPVKVNGLPVYLLSDSQQLVRNQLGKQPPESQHGSILVDARIHLKHASIKTSEQGGGRKSVYAVVIEELYSSQWYNDR